MQVQKNMSIMAVRSKKGQAVVETIFLLPLLMAFVFIILQAYYLVHKAQVSQKLLKNIVIGNVANRHYMGPTALLPDINNFIKGNGMAFIYAIADSINDPACTSPGKKYCMAYKFSIPEWLAWVVPADKRSSFKDLEQRGVPAVQKMGFCFGGFELAQYSKLSPSIFNVDNKPWTCNNY